MIGLPIINVVDSRPARSAGRIKNICFKTLEDVCVCYERSILSFKVIKIHPVLLADESSISKNTHNANFNKCGYNKLFKASYCRYLIGDPHILFFLFAFLVEKSSRFVFKEILVTQT